MAEREEGRERTHTQIERRPGTNLSELSNSIMTQSPNPNPTHGTCIENTFLRENTFCIEHCPQTQILHTAPVCTCPYCVLRVEGLGLESTP